MTRRDAKCEEHETISMEYKGYVGQVEYDDENGVFHGEVMNLRDVITFEAERIEDLPQAFRESVEDYMAFCKENP